jgi:hypothetical protein
MACVHHHQSIESGPRKSSRAGDKQASLFPAATSTNRGVWRVVLELPNPENKAIK